MKWKLDRASYYPLIATALNKSESESKRGRKRKSVGAGVREQEKMRERG